MQFHGNARIGTSLPVNSHVYGQLSCRQIEGRSVSLDEASCGLGILGHGEETFIFVVVDRLEPVVGALSAWVDHHDEAESLELRAERRCWSIN